MTVERGMEEIFGNTAVLIIYLPQSEKANSSWRIKSKHQS
jgi:hypothetical protein